MSERSGPDAATISRLLRELAPQVLGATVRRFRDFPASEDAVQEALLAAAVQWPQQGLPAEPVAWLIRRCDSFRQPISPLIDRAVKVVSRVLVWHIVSRAFSRSAMG